jgi:hypothetical protein
MIVLLRNSLFPFASCVDGENGHGIQIEKKGVPEGKVPEAIERPVQESQPMGRAAEQAQRESDTLRDIRGTFGDYLTEVDQSQAEPVAAPILFHAYDRMLQTRATVTRESVRKHLFQSALQFGKKLNGFTDDEIESFTDQSAMHQVSAAEYKRQMAMYGDVRLSRVPSKETSLLEQIVKNTTRKS